MDKFDDNNTIGAMNEAALPGNVLGINEEFEVYWQRLIIRDADRSADFTYVNNVTARSSAVQKLDRRWVALWRPDRMISVRGMVSWEVELLAHTDRSTKMAGFDLTIAFLSWHLK